MVKGLARRVIVVKPEQNKIFEQAIFILKDNVGVVDENELVKQACQCAQKYVKQHGKGKITIPAPAFVAAGAAVTGMAWLATRLI